MWGVTVSVGSAAPASPPAGTAPPPRLEAIIPYGGGWKDHQVQEPIILINPKDPSKLIMFYAGSKKPGGQLGSLAKAWALRSDPFTWHEDPANPLLEGVSTPAFDEGSYIRIDSVLYRRESDEYWIYYTGNGPVAKGDAVGLVVCPAGADGYREVRTENLRRFAGNPVLSPKGQGRDDETYVSQAAVWREGESWYAFYSYRTATQTLPGIRLARSNDGRVWTKVPGPDLFSAAPESQYIEWHQIYKMGDRYVLLYEAYNGGQRWRANVATSRELTRGWVKLPPETIDQVQWTGYADDRMYHLATPALYRFDGKWFMYFQAAPAGYYIKQHWTLWAREADSIVDTILR